METTLRLTAVCLLALLLPLSAAAQDSGWVLRVRGINVSPNESSDQITTTGTEIEVDSDTVPEVDITYMLNERWGVEVIAATSNHELGTAGGALGGLSAGEVAVLPPTITAQYHFPTSGSAHFYAGAGINFTTFYDYDVSADLQAAGVRDVDFDSSFGLAGQLGVDIDLGPRWLLNFDVKYISMSTDADLRLEGGGTLDTVSVDINPFVFGVGVGYRF